MECIVCVVANWMENYVFIIMWKKFEPIWIYLDMGFTGVHARYISCSYKCAFFIFVSWSHFGLLNNIHMTSCEFNMLVDTLNIPSTPSTRPSCVA